MVNRYSTGLAGSIDQPLVSFGGIHGLSLGIPLDATAACERPCRGLVRASLRRREHNTDSSRCRTRID